MTPSKYIKTKRQKRELIIIAIIIFLFILFTYIETRVLRFGADIPVSSTILMFTLINLNMLLLLLLVFLVFRNVLKLLYERRLKIIGSKLRTKLVIAFLALSLIPTFVLFHFSIYFISTSIEFWFDAPIELGLNNSLSIGRSLYDYVENNNSFYLKKISRQIYIRSLLKRSKRLRSYLETARRTFNLYAVEIYSTDHSRISIAITPDADQETFSRVSTGALNKKLPENGIRHVKLPVVNGEFIKSIGTVPFGFKDTSLKHILVVTTLITKDLSQKLRSVRHSYEEYYQFKLLKNPIKTTHYITLSIVALLIAFGAIWFGLHLSKSLSVPIRNLAEATHRVAEGDLSFTISQVADDEIGTLVNSFNKMTRDLRTSRDQLEFSAKKLKEQNVEIEERRQYMEIVLQNITTGVISLDQRACVSTINKSAEKMLCINSKKIIGKKYSNLLDSEQLDMAKEVMEKLKIQNSVEQSLRLNIQGRPRNFLIHFIALKDLEQYIGTVVVFDDLTEQEKVQRVAAWREVARRIAHEVKNPLTPINLSAQRLKRKYSKELKDLIFDECVETIIDQVQQIRNLVNEFTAYARFPKLNPVLCELPPLIDEAVGLYREGTPHITFKIDIKNSIPRMNIDRQQIKRALINFFDNAISVIGKQGSISISLKHIKKQKVVIMEISDSGPGISPQEKNRIFDPYYSTKKTGTGLGLSIVNTIISDHNGKITVKDNNPQGTTFIVELPI